MGEKGLTVMAMAQRLRDLAGIGIVNAREDRAILNAAADMLDELARYKIEHLPPPTDRDWALMLEECTNRGTRIQVLEKEVKRLTLLLNRESARYPDDYDEKRTSGLLEE